MFLSLAVALAVVSQPSGDDLNGPQFARLIKGLHGQFRDIEFYCEGSVRYVGSKGLLGNRMKDFGDDFQAVFAYRPTATAALDLLSLPVDANKSKRRVTYALLNYDDYVTTRIFSNRSIVTNPHMGNMLGLIQEGSPSNVYWGWFFMDQVPEDGPTGYQFRGWETIDGHRCAVVQMRPRGIPDAMEFDTYRFWVDLERGGHPLRVEIYYKAELEARTEIQLAHVPGPGPRHEPVWFPIKA